MGGLILVVFYGSILFCLIVSALKIVHYASAPLHLHWEIFQGSSLYESTDWWDHPPVRFLEKLKTVAADLFFLRGYYRRDRELWIVLYLFHLGIYLLILWHIWLFAGSVLLDVSRASAFGRVWGHLATGLAFAGGAGILLQRIAHEDLRIYYPPIHYIKWIFILITLLGGFYSVDFYFGGKMPALLKYVRDQVTFQDFEHKIHPALATGSHALFASVWLVYLPFSHMMKLFFRYYHHLRWDEVPNRKGSLVEARIKALLTLPITWSAPHIRSGKTWSEVASQSGEEIPRKHR